MSKSRRLAGICLLAAASLAVSNHASARGHGRDRAENAPLVIGHRGAAGYLPDHTLEGYALAIAMGADYVEPDLVATKDGHLIARHEPNMIATTNVASLPQFASRKRTAVVDGVPEVGFFASDFTLAEIKTLRAIQPLADRDPDFNGQFEIPTLEEVIQLVKRKSAEEGRRIGIYPETKHPTFFRAEGLPLERLLVKTLNRNGLNHRRAKVFVQSFEISNLKALNRVLRVPLVQLLDSPDVKPGDVLAAGGTTTYGDLATADGLKGVAKYADGVGPFKDYIIPRDASNHSLPPTTFVADAHAAGLVVHPYTFRNENQFLPVEDQRGPDPNAYGNAFAEDQRFFAAGVDGIFTDNPDTGVAARNEGGF